MSQFTGKKILITGAASGIGQLMAKQFAAQGAELVLWDINADSLNAFCSALRSEGYRATSYKCNLASREEIQQVAMTVLNRQGAIDILINNAGVVTGRPLLDNSDQQIEQMFNVNVLAGIHVIRAFLPAMIERGAGHIVFIASAAALCAAPRLVVYSATKYALRGVEEALRLEIKHLGYKVKTTIVFPFYFDSSLFSGAKSRFPFLLPIQSQQQVASRIVKAVRREQPRVFIPRFAYLAVVAQILPIRIFDALIAFFGINQSMDEFRGRSEKPDDTDNSPD